MNPEPYCYTSTSHSQDQLRIHTGNVYKQKNHMTATHNQVMNKIIMTHSNALNTNILT